MQHPRVPQWSAVLSILKYLQGCPEKALFYTTQENGNALEIQGFVDADWTGFISDRRSTSWYCIYLGGNLVAWKSKKQYVVARSSAEVLLLKLQPSLSR